MENIFIEKTANSPKVILDAEKGLIEFEGKSYPENTLKFFKPLIKWFEDYFNGNAQENTTVNIKFIYFNSATNQALFDIFDIIQDGTYNELEINWFYSSDGIDGMDDFEDYSDEFQDLNIKAIAYS